MKANHEILISKYIDKKTYMAVILFVQAVSAAEQAFFDFEQNKESKDIDSGTKILKALAYARFFSEACGWVSLAMKRLRQDDEKYFSAFLEKNKRYIDNLYQLRIEVNHKYNEDLADAYRNSNYSPQRHQESLAFNFSIVPDGPGFRIGTQEINMVSQLAVIQKLETALVEL